MQPRTAYKILTFGQNQLIEHCHELQRKVEAAGFAPDLVLTIAKGGDYVGELMFCDVGHASVKCARPSTRFKPEALKAALRLLPRSLCDRLRIIESRWRSRRRDALPRELHLSPDLAMRIRGARRVLVVDDAVDSGATLAAVMNAVRCVDGERVVKAAALTVTMQHPLASPDFTIFNENVLIRFPWSLDS